MKTLTLIVLLTTSQFAHALTKSEQTCLALNIYHEGRSLPVKDWKKIASVAINRSKIFGKYKFGAKSKHLCDIVKSNEYPSHKKFKNKILEPKLYNKIFSFVRSNKTYVPNILFFELKGTKHIYSTTLN